MIVCAAVIGQQVGQLSRLISYELTLYDHHIESYAFSMKFYA